MSSTQSHQPYYSHQLSTDIALIDIHQCYPEVFPFLLDTAIGTHDQHRYSMLLAAVDQTPLALSFEQLSQPDQPSFLQQLDQQFSEHYQAEHGDLPFIGGWFLLLGYELAKQIEPKLRLQAPEHTQPVASAWRCDSAIILDRQTNRQMLVAETAERLAELTALLEPMGDIEQTTAAADQSRNQSHTWQITAGSGERFCQGVEKIQEYVRAGDVFQVNLSRGWHARPDLEAIDNPDFAIDIYRALRRANASPFAGMMRFDDGVLLSSSPERLLEIDQGWIQTRPIAGTRPRGRDAEDDLRLSDELLAHPKERAEHIMLIDLERNDLGRVCEPGSVEVNELMVKESYASVHHIVSNVRGRLRQGITPGQAIAAVFPGGTITGCPKVRCMEIIAELEDTGRGFYTGAMGYLSRHGRLDMNILIRSMLWQDGALHWRTGCGIVADSEPQAELAETEAKAAGMLRALEMIEPADRPCAEGAD